jgi:hypothetical protein
MCGIPMPDFTMLKQLIQPLHVFSGLGEFGFEFVNTLIQVFDMPLRIYNTHDNSYLVRS